MGDRKTAGVAKRAAGAGVSVSGPGRHDGQARAEVPDEALGISLGCGNPTAVADLHEGEVVLDLGSGGGADVLLSARRVGPAGRGPGPPTTPQRPGGGPAQPPPGGA